MAAAHLFLGDELGQAIRPACAARTTRDLKRPTAREWDHIKLRILDVSHPLAVGRKLGVEGWDAGWDAVRVEEQAQGCARG